MNEELTLDDINKLLSFCGYARDAYDRYLWYPVGMKAEQFDELDRLKRKLRNLRNCFV